MLGESPNAAWPPAFKAGSPDIKSDVSEAACIRNKKSNYESASFGDSEHTYFNRSNSFDYTFSLLPVNHEHLEGSHLNLVLMLRRCAQFFLLYQINVTGRRFSWRLLKVPTFRFYLISHNNAWIEILVELQNYCYWEIRPDNISEDNWFLFHTCNWIECIYPSKVYLSNIV